MFLGHFGVGFGAKRAAPEVSLGSLFLAAQFVDLLWPTLLLLGVEKVRINPQALPGPPLEFVHYPISHSLLAVFGWALLLGTVYYARRRNLFAALILGALVLSHWLLDLLVHYPDLPVVPGGGLDLGLGLWSRPGLALGLELLIFIGGLALYLRCTRPLDSFGKWGLWGLAGFLVAIQLANSFGPPPPSVEAVAWAGQAQWLLVAGGFWLDQHRRSVEPRSNQDIPL